MKARLRGVIGITTFLSIFWAAGLAQDRDQGQNRGSDAKFDDRARQTANDWYNQHRDRPPAGFRQQDRLSADQESRLREGVVLDPDLRRHVRNAPADLRRQLPSPPPQHR